MAHLCSLVSSLRDVMEIDCLCVRVEMFEAVNLRLREDPDGQRRYKWLSDTVTCSTEENEIDQCSLTHIEPTKDKQ